MAKRKREIQKRKKLVDEPWKQEVPSTAASAGGVESSADQGESVAVRAETSKMGPTGEGSRIAAPPAATRAGGKPAHRKAETARRPGGDSAGRGRLTRSRENFLLGMLVIYVLLLGLGTAGELFEIEWILNLPLFK